jgi:hypothetical protein
MTPAGYLLKHVARRPAWLKALQVDDIYSLSGCVSANFTDYIQYWKHNGYWLFDAPAAMRAIATANNIDLAGTTLFYYEVFEEEYDEDTKTWRAFAPDASVPTKVEPPKAARLGGFDVASFWAKASAECSPLSCNGLAETLAVNRHCLFASLDEARQALQAGAFDNSEPGPFRIFAVHTVAMESTIVSAL